MSSDIRIRRATKKDMPALIRLQKNDGFPHRYYLTLERLERLCDRGEQFFLARVDGTPVGFGSIDCEIRACIHFLSVDTSYSRRGIGSMLLRFLLGEANRRGYSRAHAYVEANSPIEFFLQKHGFFHVGHYNNRYGNGKDAMIWEVALAPN